MKRGKQTPRRFKSFESSQTNNKEIENNSDFVFDIDQRFAPWDIVEVTNLDPTNDCIAIKNFSQKEILPAGNTIILRSVNELTIRNLGGSTISVDKIRLYLEHQSRKNELINKGLSALPSAIGFLK